MVPPSERLDIIASGEGGVHRTRLDGWRYHKRDRDWRFTKKPGGGCTNPNGSVTERRESEYGPRQNAVENIPRLYQLWCPLLVPLVLVLDVIRPRSSSPLDLSPGTITRAPRPLRAREIAEVDRVRESLGKSMTLDQWSRNRKIRSVEGRVRSNRTPGTRSWEETKLEQTSSKPFVYSPSTTWKPALRP